MKLTPSNTVEAPIDRVFDALLEIADPGMALPQNAEVTRLDDLDRPGPGMRWRITLDLRGHRREVLLELVDCTRPGQMRFEAESPGLAIWCTAALTAPGPDSTQVDLDIDLKPQNLSSRLLVNSLKLAKYHITRRLETKLGAVFARIGSPGPGTARSGS